MQKLKLQFKIRAPYFYAALLSFLLFALPLVSLGAALYLVPPKGPVHQGDVFPVEVRLDSKEAPVNAVEAGVEFLSDALEIVSVEKANSILRLWPHEPAFSNVLRLVSFIGGLPTPGFQGDNGLIGVIYFRAKAPGAAELAFRENSRALLNDGTGGEAMLEFKNIVLRVIAAPEEYAPKEPALPPDTKRPDEFIPVIGRDERAFGGKYFIAFETQDHESGISRYEVRETRDGKEGEWRVAVSPSVLENQEGMLTVRVKAVDRAGNETIGIAEVSIPKKRPSAEPLAVFVLILLGFGAWLSVRYFNARKKH